MPRAVLILFAALGSFGVIALAPMAAVQTDKKTDAGKPKTDVGKPKSKDPEKTKPPEKPIDPPKELPKPKVPLDKMRFPKDTIIVVVDDLLNAPSLFPKTLLLNAEKYQELIDQIDALKGQLKAERKAPSWCKLQGKLEGDFLVFRAEYSFSTERPRTTVLLGLQGGHLTEEGDLDRQIANLDYDKDDGFVVRVEKEGSHQLTLHFRVPVQTKKSSGGAIEREIDLGLPGAAGTVLNLELSTAVKELRWNKTLEKTKTPGRWQIGLGMVRAVNLAWKEPLALAGNAPLTKVESQIKVDVDATHVTTSADLFLEDTRLQTTKWHLFLPSQAKIEEVKAPGGLTYELIAPDKGRPHYTLETSAATGERWRVKVLVRVPRPNPGARIAIGPFHVLGVFQQTGTITVNNPADSSLGQRMIATRRGEVYQHVNTETEAGFTYVAPLVAENNVKAMQELKAPVELEWRAEKSQLETHVEHELKVQSGPQRWEVEVTTTIHAKALFATIYAVDLRLPRTRPQGLALIGAAAPGLEFPGALPWAGFWNAYGLPWAPAPDEELKVRDEQGTALTVIPEDATGRSRVLLRSPAKKATLVLKNTFHIPVQNQRLRMQLPRPLHTQDRGAKLTMQTDKHVELIHGPAGAEEPVPGRDRLILSWDQSPGEVDLAWRLYQNEVTAHSTVDVVLHKHTAEVTQTLRLPKEVLNVKAGPRSSQIALRLPGGIDVKVLPGWEKVSLDAARRILWIRPDVDDDAGKPSLASDLSITVQYDVAILDGHLDVSPVWPMGASKQDVKVRVWSTAGLRPSLADPGLQRGLWKERSVEVVKGKGILPALVIQAIGSKLPLVLKVEDVAAAQVAAFFAERAVIQVRLLDDGSRRCRALYLIHRMHAPHVDVELPLPAALLREGPTVTLGNKPEPLTKIDASGKLIRIKLYPDHVASPAVLEISYTIPFDSLEGSSFLRTTLPAPKFRSDVMIGSMRWQLGMPTPMLGAASGRHARPDLQWTIQGGLLSPEPSGTLAELEPWANVAESSPFTYSFTQVSLNVVTVYYLPRTWVLLGCSGLFLIVALGGYLSPLPRWVFWPTLMGLALIAFMVAMILPAFVPPILFGAQPGMVLFALFAAGHWLVQERQRRHLAFPAGFSRTKPGSTMVRTSPSKSPHEPSTVDEPDALPAAVAEKPTASKSS